MAVNALNFVLTRTILDRAVANAGREPTDEQKKDITKASFVSALTPGNLGMVVPFIVRDSIVGDEEDDGDGEGGHDDEGVEVRLKHLEEWKDSSQVQLAEIRAELQGLGSKLDKLVAATPGVVQSSGATTKSGTAGSKAVSTATE